MPDNGVEATIDGMRVSRAQYLILGVCFCLTVIDGYDVLSMAFAAPPLASDWQLPADRLGIVLSAGVLGMTLGAMFITPLTDLVGRRPMVLCGVAVMSVSMFATAYAPGLAWMVALRVITGLGIGAMLASLTALVSEFFPSRHRDLAVGLMLAGYPLGATLGGFVAAQLIPSYGWQGVFVFGGAITLLLLPAVFFLLPESAQFLIHRRPADALARLNNVLHRLSIEPLQTLPAASPPPRAHVASLLAPHYRRATLTLWVGYFFNFGTLYFLLSWIPKLLVDYGMPLNQAISAGIAFNLGGALGNLGIGWVAARLGLGRSIMQFTFAAMLCLLALAWVPMDVAALLAVTGILGFFQQGSLIGFYAIAARLYPAAIRTTGIGWGIGLGRFGAVIGPALGGVLITQGWTVPALFVFFAIPLAISGVAAVLVRPPAGGAEALSAA